MTTPETLAERLARCLKPLEWKQAGGDIKPGAGYSAWGHLSHTPFTIYHKHDGWWLNVDCRTHPTLEAAQAAAQADYTARILAALDMDALAREVEAMVGAEKRRCLSIVRKEMRRNERDGDPWNTGARCACRDIYIAIRAREGGKP